MSDDLLKLAALGLSERGLENLATAERFMKIAIGFGHGPGAMAKKGERIAGFLYRNDDAVKGEVLPAHSMSAIRELIIELSECRARARSAA